MCHHFTSAQHSCHVDRKLFKMRELRGAKIVTVAHIPTDTNPADIFTKILSRATFEKHRATVMNLAASHDDHETNSGENPAGASPTRERAGAP